MKSINYTLSASQKGLSSESYMMMMMIIIIIIMKTIIISSSSIITMTEMIIYSTDTATGSTKQYQTIKK